MCYYIAGIKDNKKLKQDINMILKDRIPKEFYGLFRTKNMESYMQIVTGLYEENNQLYASYGLTREECHAIIEDIIANRRIVWQEEPEEIIDDTQEYTASFVLTRLIKWGWLNSDFDEKINTYVISFPEYSQMYAQLFKNLLQDDADRERESMLSIYSALFTYQLDSEKNNDILKNALYSTKGLGQLLSNMQDGMRSYFEELSDMKNFIGIQQVLINEINNSDSKKYAILTTSDSFYRYKEEVKELICQIINDNDIKKCHIEAELRGEQKGTLEYKRLEYRLEYCQKADTLVSRLEREFDLIERKYNKLIEQKTVFAKRALARIHYILQEGATAEDNSLRLVALLNKSNKSDEILRQLRSRIKLSAQFKNVTDDSFSGRRERIQEEYVPYVTDITEAQEEQRLTDFVPKPLYTQKQLLQFREKNTVNGRFETSSSTVTSIEELEMLMFLWQEETNLRMAESAVSIEGEIKAENGITYSRLMIDK